MIKTLKKTCLILTLLTIHFTSFTQETTGIGIGYNTGFFNTGMRNVEILAYEFNQDHPNYEQQYDVTSRYQGFSLLFYQDKENLGLDMGMEFKFSNKMIFSAAMGADNPGDTIYKRQLRVMMNTFSMGWYIKPINNLSLGADWDILSRTKITKKIGPESMFKEQERVAVFNKKGFFTFGMTIFAEYQFKFLKLRPYAQFDAFPREIEFGTNTYSFKMSNVGIALFIVKEEKD